MSTDNPSSPFYAHPMDKKRSVLLVKEAKAEIKKLESHRPITPFGRKNCQMVQSEENVCLASRKLLPLDTLKKFDSGPKNLKLEPIVTKQTSKTSKLSLSKLQYAEFEGFPPIADGEKVIDSSEKNVETSGNEYFELEEDFPLMIADNVHSSEETKIKADVACVNGELREIQDTPLQCDIIEKPLIDEVSKEVAKFIMQLEKYIRLGRKKKEKDVIPIVSDIYQLLSYNNAFEIKISNRIALLKSLFKLLDASFPALCFNVIKLLLEMKVRDNNLTNILKLCLKLINEEKVDLNHYQLTEPLLESIWNTNILSNKEASLHGAMLLKRLIVSSDVTNVFIRKCTIIFFHHLSKSNIMLSSEGSMDEICRNLIIEIVSALHFMSGNKEAWNILVIPENTAEILKVLNYSSDVPEIIQITVRLLSKIVDREGGCEAVVACSEDLLLTFNQIFQTYKHCIDIIVQATFIVGNIVSSSEKVALLFFTMPAFKKILVDILEEYVSKHLQLKGHASEKIKSEEFGDRNWYRDIFEVITKVLCILANVCLSPKAGLYLSQENHLIMHLLKYVGKYTSESCTSDTTVPLYSFLVVINNITYFLSPDSPMCIHIAESIIPLLDESFAYEVRLEAANISQNLTRSTEVRKFILDKSLLPAFINLLNEDNKEFNVVSYGIIMNVLLDPDSRKMFYEEQGLTRVLHKLHLCGYRDWKISALLCQILWNYFGGSSVDNVPISKMELQHLIKYLSYSIYNENNDELIVSEEQIAWRNEFCPVAKNLLHVLKSKLPSISS